MRETIRTDPRAFVGNRNCLTMLMYQEISPAARNYKAPSEMSTTFPTAGRGRPKGSTQLEIRPVQKRQPTQGDLHLLELCFAGQESFTFADAKTRTGLPHNELVARMADFRKLCLISNSGRCTKDHGAIWLRYQDGQQVTTSKPKMSKAEYMARLKEQGREACLARAVKVFAGRETVSNNELVEELKLNRISVCGITRRWENHGIVERAGKANKVVIWRMVK